MPDKLWTPGQQEDPPVSIKEQLTRWLLPTPNSKPPEDAPETLQQQNDQ